MGSVEGSQVKVRILTVFKDQDLQRRALAELERHYPGQLETTQTSLTQEAIEIVEQGVAAFDLILIQHDTPSLTVLKILLDLTETAVPILISSQTIRFDPLLARDRAPEIVASADLEHGLYRILLRGVLLNRLPGLASGDPFEYVQVSVDSLKGIRPLQNDVYVKFGESHFVCVFKHGEVVNPESLKKFIDTKRNEFFIKKAEIGASLDHVADQLEKLGDAGRIEPKVASQVFDHAYHLVSDVVAQVGFTPEVQRIVKSSVAMTIKTLGSKPRLSAILEDLKVKEGSYISGHSLMIANVGCALACRVGWTSATTQFKICLAAFLHDISINQEVMARIRSMDEVRSVGLDAEQVKELRLHPIRAGEYARQFSEIPTEVEQIVIQHHERPDGSGFPRGLNAMQISPLGALFIIAEDLVHEALENPGITVESFFQNKSTYYSRGQFKKIATASKNA